MSQSFKYSLVIFSSLAIGIPQRFSCSELFVFWAFLCFINNFFRLLSSLLWARSCVSFLQSTPWSMYYTFVFWLQFTLSCALCLWTSWILIWCRSVQFCLGYLFGVFSPYLRVSETLQASRVSDALLPHWHSVFWLFLCLPLNLMPAWAL